MGCVYVIGPEEGEMPDPPRVKIGHSSAHPAYLDRRLSSLQIGSPLRLKLYGYAAVPDARAAETEIHRKLAYCRMHGEWFRITPEKALAAINGHAANVRGYVSPMQRRVYSCLGAVPYPKHYKEIAEEIGMTPGYVRVALTRLKKKGLVAETGAGKWRIS